MSTMNNKSFMKYLKIKLRTILWQCGLYKKCPYCCGTLTGHGFEESFYYESCACGFKGEWWTL